MRIHAQCTCTSVYMCTILIHFVYTCIQTLSYITALCVLSLRCKIPVVVMGETGCGKTRLIRFMCDMIAVSAGGGRDCVKNMLIMKVSILSIIQSITLCTCIAIAVLIKHKELINGRGIDTK